MEHLSQSFAETDRYNSTIFSHCTRPARILMVHESWHHTYTDLYRIFLTGYREAAPPSALEGINPEVVVQKRLQCLDHALSIVQIFKDFVDQSDTLVIDFDTAIYAYHSARIVLFCAQRDTVTYNLSMVAALEKARFCQYVMNRYFQNSPVVEPMVSFSAIIVVLF